MADLSHWDVAIDFTGEEVAALVLGKDPAEASYARTVSKPLYELTERCYNFARDWHRDRLAPLGDNDGCQAPHMLECIRMPRMVEDQEPGSSHYYYDWLCDDEKSGFQTQRFSRQELVRWLAAVQVNSIYPFDRQNSSTNAAVQNETVLRSDASTPGAAAIIPTKIPNRWTPESLEKMKVYRDKNGTKATATHFGISTTRIRKLLPRKKPSAIGSSVFHQM